MIFRVGTYRFEFRVEGSVYFPPGKAGNVLRGALGGVLAACAPVPLNRVLENGLALPLADARGSATASESAPVFLSRDCEGAVRSLFPQPARRPSGLKEPPRPFVLRAAHLDGRRFEPGELFAVDVHVFALHEGLFEIFDEAFANLALAGLGPGRGAVALVRPGKRSVVEIDLDANTESASRIRVFFRTPTELKGNSSHDELPFGVLFARIRDRIATLCNLYGKERLSIDFAALGERANRVKTVSCDLGYHDVSRRSSRTGAVHGIGGFTGTMEYEGDVAEFLPYLRAAWWTGAGRHTVWGNGVIEVVVVG